MTKKLSKTQLISAIVAGLGIVFAIVSYFVPQIQIAGEALINIGIGSGITAISGYVGIFKDYADKTQAEIEKGKEIAEKKEQIAGLKSELKGIKHPAKPKKEKVKKEKKSKQTEEKVEVKVEETQPTQPNA